LFSVSSLSDLLRQSLASWSHGWVNHRSSQVHSLQHNKEAQLDLPSILISAVTAPRDTCGESTVLLERSYVWGWG